MSHSGSGSRVSSSKYCSMFVIIKYCFRLLSISMIFSYVVIGIALESILDNSATICFSSSSISGNSCRLLSLFLTSSLFSLILI